MNVAEWILVAFLSIALLIFLSVATILVIMLIGVASEAKKVVIKSQDIADNANGIVENVKGMTSIGGIVQTFTDKFIDPKKSKRKEQKNGKTAK